MKVMVGLSGGVDSAVAAYLLKKQGYDVVACFMRNWDAMANGDYLGNPTVNDDQCPQEKDYQDAQKVAEKLGIPLLRVDFIKEYWDHVFSFFISEYENGRTPNPDILCNKYIKFDAFLEFAKKNNCDMIAMGHYAKRVEKDGHFYLMKCHDTNKDQTYFLSQINEEQIKSCLFPLGDIDKTEVRRIAHELDLESVMDKKDSTGVCFIGERNFKEILKNYITPKLKGVGLLSGAAIIAEITASKEKIDECKKFIEERNEQREAADDAVKAVVRLPHRLQHPAAGKESADERIKRPSVGRGNIQGDALG